MKKPKVNPKQGFGDRKVPLVSVVPTRVMAGVALAFMEGHRKGYRAYNYRDAGVKASTYVDAATRHILQYWEGEDIDSESKAGLHHIDKALASLMVLRDCMLRGNLTDDRPPASDSVWVGHANDMAGALVDAFPDDVKPYTEKAD